MYNNSLAWLFIKDFLLMYNQVFSAKDRWEEWCESFHIYVADTYDGAGMPSALEGGYGRRTQWVYKGITPHVIENLQWPYPCSELEHGMFKHGVTGWTHILQHLAGGMQHDNSLSLSHSVLPPIPEHPHICTVCLSPLSTAAVCNDQSWDWRIVEFWPKHSPAEYSDIISCNSCQSHCKLNTELQQSEEKEDEEIHPSCWEKKEQDCKEDCAHQQHSHWVQL